MPATSPSPRPPAAAGGPEPRPGTRTVRLAFWGLVAAALAVVFLLPRQPPPPPSPAREANLFVDRVGVVSPAFAREMGGVLGIDSRIEIVVYVDRAPPTGDIVAWTIQTASDWKVGGGKADNGIVLFVFPDARSARLEVGYGLEDVLPDARVRQLLAATLVAPFEAGDYERGLEAFRAEVRRLMGGDAGVVAAPTARDVAATESWGTMLRSAWRRAPRLLHGAWREFVEGSASTRIGVLAFSAVGLGVAVLNLFFFGNTLWRLATLPGNWQVHRARPGQSPGLAPTPGGKPRAARAAAAAAPEPRSWFTLVTDLKLFEIVFGLFGLALCTAVLVLLLAMVEGKGVRQGHFSGAGALVTWAPSR